MEVSLSEQRIQYLNQNFRTMNRYKDIKTLKNSEGFYYRRNTIFPEIKESLTDIYVITTAGDRFDTLALQYYRDSSLWWVIAGVNKSKKDSLVVAPGLQIRIPMDVNNILEEFNDLNNDR